MFFITFWKIHNSKIVQIVGQKKSKNDKLLQKISSQGKISQNAQFFLILI